MTPRPRPEWIGRHAMTAIPIWVKKRIMRRHADCCASCFRRFGPKLRPEFDHRPPMDHGGENRESMIEPVCHECHLKRSGIDTHARAFGNRMKAWMMGYKTPSRHPVPGSRNTMWAKRYNRETGRFETVRRDNK